MSQLVKLFPSIIIVEFGLTSKTSRRGLPDPRFKIHKFQNVGPSSRATLASVMSSLMIGRTIPAARHINPSGPRRGGLGLILSAPRRDRPDQLRALGRAVGCLAEQRYVHHARWSRRTCDGVRPCPPAAPGTAPLSRVLLGLGCRSQPGQRKRRALPNSIDLPTLCLQTMRSILPEV